MNIGSIIAICVAIITPIAIAIYFLINKIFQITKEFFEFSKNFGINVSAEFEKYILNGKSILLEGLPTTLSENFNLIEKGLKNFNPGFNFIETKKNKKVVGLNINSNTYKVGLRNGMIYIKSRYSTRRNGWSKNRPMKVYVTMDNQ